MNPKAARAKLARISALLEPFNECEERLATEIAVARCAGRDTRVLEKEYNLVSKWMDCGSRYWDSAKWDFDRISEDFYAR